MPEHSEKILILIVDDTESNVRLLAHVLNKEGYSLMAAFSGAEALSLVKKRRPDVILLDVMMPDMNGFEVCEQLKSNDHYRDIPVIFLSALSETDSKIKGFDAGGVDYITKPFQRQEVIARIELHVKLKRLQDELSDKIKQLKRREQNLEILNREKDELIRIVGHDFRNPVTGIMGLAGFLQENGGMDPGEQSEMLGVIKKSGQNLLALVNELLTKDERANISELKLVEVDPKTILRKIIDLHRPTAINKNITVNTDFSDVGLFNLDRHKVEQIFSNLLSNALKFTSEGGAISLSLREANGKSGAVVFVIEDSGVGIPKDQLDSIWQPDTRKTTHGTSGEEGSGMGLELVKNFTHLHGGDISVESAEGEGTRFTVQLYNQH